MPARTILFAGGGTGGHIFPNMAVLERLRERRLPIAPHFLISSRPLDRRIVQQRGMPFTAIPARPAAMRPDRLLRFYRGFRASEAMVERVIANLRPAAMVATGGFVCAPAVRAAWRASLPVAVVNLDAVPGRANRFIASKATAVFSVYPTAMLSHARLIGLPMRREVIAPCPPGEARRGLGLEEDRPTLLVFAGSQGGATVNRMMMELCGRARPRDALVEQRWQVLHLSGFADQQQVQQAYDRAGVRATTAPFCHAMGLAWSAATLAIARAGAGTVGEAWANAVPTLFFPYPHHRDEHQRLNAQPLVDAGGAMMFHDRIDPTANVDQAAGPLASLVASAEPRERMREALRRTRPEDGAWTIARWLAEEAGPTHA